MARHKIGVIIPLSLREKILADKDFQRLFKLGEVVATDSRDPISVQQACELLADCTIALGSWRTPYPNAEIVKACPKLRLWEHAAGTVKHMFGPHLKGSKLKIGTCRMAIADNVAEIAVAELIIGLRQAFQNAEAGRKGRAKKTEMGKPLSISTIGVVGASEVGKRVLKLLRAFRCKIKLYDPFVSEKQAKAMRVTLFRDLAELCAASDAVTMHTPAIPATEKMMGAAQFAAMRDGAVFVNTARGMCVDQAALIAELQKGRIFAYLDVTYPEPAPDDSPLRTLPNCWLTSHIAGCQATNIGKQAVDEIKAFVTGGKPIDLISPAMLDRIA